MKLEEVQVGKVYTDRDGAIFEVLHIEHELDIIHVKVIENPDKTNYWLTDIDDVPEEEFGKELSQKLIGNVMFSITHFIENKFEYQQNNN